MDGFRVVKLEEVASVVDIVITATGRGREGAYGEERVAHTWVERGRNIIHCSFQVQNMSSDVNI